MFSALKTLYQQYRTRHVFGRWAESYDADVRENRYSAAKAVREALLPMLQPTSRIVDLGIGTGLIWDNIDIPEEAEITGLDISAPMMEQASSIMEIGPLFLCDVGRQEWPVYEGTEDMIVAAGLFEYMTPDMAQHIFKEALRVLKPGGRLIFTYIPAETTQQSIWNGRSGNILTCQYDPAWMEKQEGFTLLQHTPPFSGSVFEDGKSYDYRLIIFEKTA